MCDKVPLSQRSFSWKIPCIKSSLAENAAGNIFTCRKTITTTPPTTMTEPAENAISQQTNSKGQTETCPTTSPTQPWTLAKSATGPKSDPGRSLFLHAMWHPINVLFLLPRFLPPAHRNLRYVPSSPHMRAFFDPSEC